MSANFPTTQDSGRADNQAEGRHAGAYMNSELHVGQGRSNYEWAKPQAGHNARALHALEDVYIELINEDMETKNR